MTTEQRLIAATAAAKRSREAAAFAGLHQHDDNEDDTDNNVNCQNNVVKHQSQDSFPYGERLSKAPPEVKAAALLQYIVV
jgi:hypothetical protein